MRLIKGVMGLLSVLSQFIRYIPQKGHTICFISIYFWLKFQFSWFLYYIKVLFTIGISLLDDEKNLFEAIFMKWVWLYDRVELNVLPLKPLLHFLSFYKVCAIYFFLS